MDRLGVFAKYWEPGTVKTRLARVIGRQDASQLYRQFVATTLERLSALGDERTLAFAPADRREAFQQLAGRSWSVAPQSRGNLGQRMAAFFEERLTHPSDRTVLVGTDSPTLPIDLVSGAFERLEDHDVVLVPSDDGGYCLIGCRGRVPPIFDNVPWSTPDVLPVTRRRLRQHCLLLAELPNWYDVDDAADVVRLHAELHAADDDAVWDQLRAEVDAVMEHHRLRD